MGCWNIEGIYENFNGAKVSKLDDPHFQILLRKFDILCMQETDIPRDEALEIPAGFRSIPHRRFFFFSNVILFYYYYYCICCIPSRSECCWCWLNLLPHQRTCKHVLENIIHREKKNPAKIVEPAKAV